MNGHDALFNKWNDWLETINNDVTNLSTNRHVFSEVRKIVEANQTIHLPSAFYGWMGSLYAVYMSIGLRRQIDRDPRTVSFRRLLEEITDRPEVISRERYVGLYTDPVIRGEVADELFDRFAGVGQPHIDQAMVEKDCLQLVEQIEGLKEYVDKRIAHHDQQGPRSLPTYGDLDDGLDSVETLLMKYLEVLRAVAQLSILPVLPPEWKQVFRYAWIPPTEAA